MPGKIKLFLTLAISSLLLTMCRTYEQSHLVNRIVGLSCRNYIGYFEEGLETSKGLECTYACPNGTVVPLDFEVDPSVSVSKADLDRMFCGVAAPQFTPTDPAASTSPTPAASETPAASATPEATATSQASPTPQPPLLSGRVTMCDTGISLISFRIVEPPPDLAGKTLAVQIADLDTTCATNPTNPSLLTCTIPPLVTFPARVVLRLDGAVVNDFTYDGLGCAELSTPMPTTTP
ncbi:MAG: hypothetical protein ACXW4U_03575 [Anaerolineales bacterium]